MSDDSSIELDPEIAAILREAAALDLPDPTTLPIAAARAQLTAASLAWNVELPALPAVRDLNVPGPDGAMRLRLYRPRAAAACRRWSICTAAAGRSARSTPTIG